MILWWEHRFGRGDCCTFWYVGQDMSAAAIAQHLRHKVQKERRRVSGMMPDLDFTSQQKSGSACEHCSSMSLCTRQKIQ
eukprot:1760201-Amphidinium_carterae.2